MTECRKTHCFDKRNREHSHCQWREEAVAGLSAKQFPGRVQPTSPAEGTRQLLQIFKILHCLTDTSIITMIRTHLILSWSGSQVLHQEWRCNSNYWFYGQLNSVYLLHGQNRIWGYSISQEICTRFCCALLCCGYAIVHNEFTWSIYPYSSGLLCWHWGNR